MKILSRRLTTCDNSGRRRPRFVAHWLRAYCPPPLSMPTTQLLTKSDVARILKVSTRTIERLVRDRLLLVTRVRNQARFRVDDLKRYLDRHTK